MREHVPFPDSAFRVDWANLNNALFALICADADLRARYERADSFRSAGNLLRAVRPARVRRRPNSSNASSSWSADVRTLFFVAKTKAWKRPRALSSGRRVARACEDVPVVVWEYAAETPHRRWRRAPRSWTRCAQRRACATKLPPKSSSANWFPTSSSTRPARSPSSSKSARIKRFCESMIADRASYCISPCRPTCSPRAAAGLFLANEFCSELKVEISSRLGTCVSAVFAL